MPHHTIDANNIKALILTTSIIILNNNIDANNITAVILTTSIILLNYKIDPYKVNVYNINLSNAYKSCPKMISLEKLKIFTPLQKLPKNVGDLGKLIVDTGFEKLPKVYFDHTDYI